MATFDNTLSEEQKRLASLLDKFESGLYFAYIHGFVTPSEYKKITDRYEKLLPEWLKARGMELIIPEQD